MWAAFGAGSRKAVPCRLLVLGTSFVGPWKNKPGVWWGKSIPGGNGSGVQILHWFIWIMLSSWPLNTAVSLLLGVITYQETGEQNVQEKWTFFCNRQFTFWQLGWAGLFPFNLCFSVQNCRKSALSILLTLICALTQMPQIFHSWDNISHKIIFNLNVAKIWSDIFCILFPSKQTTVKAALLQDVEW